MTLFSTINLRVAGPKPSGLELARLQVICSSRAGVVDLGTAIKTYR